MIAAIKSELVERKWLTDEDFIDIITLAQTAPGLFAVNISILTGHRLRGTKGSVVATIASCLPPFLIILLVAMFFTAFQENEYDTRLQGHQACRGGSHRCTYARHAQGNEDEMVVMDHCLRFDDSGVFPEGFSYIYIDMCNRDGRVHQLV